MSLNQLPTTAPTLFVHFKNAATGDRLYVMREKEIEGGGVEVVRAKDDAGKDKPIGVMVYTPGSKMFRTASNMNSTENIKAGKKELSGAKLDEQQVNLLARTTFKLVNFEIEGGCNFESLKAFYDDEANVAYREQVADEQADLGKSLIASVKG
jgi:hypothetical protein